MMGVDRVQTKGQSKNYSFRYAIAWSWYAAVAKGPVRMIYFIYTKPWSQLLEVYLQWARHARCC
jgi:hypothetical protein